MTAIFIFLGFIFLVMGIALFFIDSRMKPAKWPLTLVGVLFFLLAIVNPLSINDAGNRQVVQTIGGDLIRTWSLCKWILFQSNYMA